MKVLFCLVAFAVSLGSVYAGDESNLKNRPSAHKNASGALAIIIEPGVSEKELSQLSVDRPKVEEIRFLAVGGPKNDVAEQLKGFVNVKHVVFHYGASEKAVKLIANFPKLAKLEFWGGKSVSFESLPRSTGVKVVVIEEIQLTQDDVVEILRAFPNLEKMVITFELPENAKELMRRHGKAEIVELE